MKITDDSHKFNYLVPNSNIEFPVKINIHIPVRGALYINCVDLNKQIIDLSESEISFQPSSFQLPHITLYMGFVTNFENLQSVLKSTAAIASKINRFEILLSKPYIKPIKNNNGWVFIDISSTELNIRNLKHQIKNQVSSHIEPLDWNVAEGQPHITLAYIKNFSTKLDSLFESWESPMQSFAEAIEVSYCGPKGTCLGSIRTFEFIDS